MKKQLYLILILFPLFAFAQSVEKGQLRNSFLQSIQRRSALDSLVTRMNAIATKTPFEECYLGICNALQIKYISSMWGKYKMLDKSRDHINQAIQRSPQDVELHFIRFMLEHNIPAVLGMSTHISEDLANVFNHPDFLNEAPDLKKMALEFILASDRCTSDQKKIAEKTLSDIKKTMYAQR
jgi:hypothetical protein